MTGWGWAIILAQLVGIVWLTMAWADSRRELRDYRRVVARMSRDAAARMDQARYGTPAARLQRNLLRLAELDDRARGGDAS